MLIKKKQEILERIADLKEGLEHYHKEKTVHLPDGTMEFDWDQINLMAGQIRGLKWC